MKTSKDIPTQTYTKTNNHVQERIPSSQLQSYPTIQNLPHSSCTSQSANNQNQQEGEISSIEEKYRIKLYAEIVKQNICHQYNNNNNTNSDTATQKYSPH